MSAPASAGFGPWASGIPEAERVARARALRALALVYVGRDHPLTVALRAAEGSEAASYRALVELDRMAALPRRKVLAAYACLARPARALG